MPWRMGYPDDGYPIMRYTDASNLAEIIARAYNNAGFMQA